MGLLLRLLPLRLLQLAQQAAVLVVTQQAVAQQLVAKTTKLANQAVAQETLIAHKAVGRILKKLVAQQVVQQGTLVAHKALTPSPTDKHNLGKKEKPPAPGKVDQSLWPPLLCSPLPSLPEVSHSLAHQMASCLLRYLRARQLSI